jgi:hypothetical protein
MNKNWVGVPCHMGAFSVKLGRNATLCRGAAWRAPGNPPRASEIALGRQKSISITFPVGAVTQEHVVLGVGQPLGMPDFALLGRSGRRLRRWLALLNPYRVVHVERQLAPIEFASVLRAAIGCDPAGVDLRSQP